MHTNKEYSKINKENIKNTIEFLFKNNYFFDILVKTLNIKTTPEIPNEIDFRNEPQVLFSLQNYAFENANIEKDYLIFETAFGSNDFVTTLKIPLLNIFQIIRNNQIMLLNISDFHEENKVVKSTNIFLNNPDNAKFLK